ncbi:hypothetical protein H5410_004625 [Solanum commersonii]|uniref:Condensin-2 complex subunit H2 n=1 Tax=Solanum commersonii TaxID=4109 RepID=A0A9J6B8N6_SOLCO|nr:hypothetical protein H5410_004625 [Solanum commersonii]
MRHDHEKLSSSNVDTNGVFHNVKPLRDLQSNWEVNLAKSLEDYLLEICSGEIAGDDDGCRVNISFLYILGCIAALLRQGAVQVYNKKVEYMYSLVLHSLKFITEKREEDHSGSVSAEAEENANDEENDPFWFSKEIPGMETKNILDDATYRDASLTQFVKAPAKLVVLEGDCLDSTGDSGELESYLLATCDIYQKVILLDSCDVVAVDSFLDNDDTVGKGLNNSFRGNYVGSKNQKSFLSPTRCFAGTANKFSTRKNQDSNFYVSPRVEPEFDPGSYNGDCEMPDNYDYNHGGEDGYVEPKDVDDFNDEDLWNPLNPHEPGILKVKPYRKVAKLSFSSFNFNRRQGVNSRKCASLASEFPLASLHGTISSDLIDIWEKKYCAMKKKGDSESPFEKVLFVDHDSSVGVTY